MRSGRRRKRGKEVNVKLGQYIHHSWEDIAQCREDKYYFVKIDAEDIEKYIKDIEFELSASVPRDLKEFYGEIGFGFLWFHLKRKKGLYRVLSPEELLDLYFEPDDDETEDEFITYRERAWYNLEGNNLLAFCLFGEEESLLYIGISNQAVYYLSPKYKIANSLNEFFELLDQEVDYFLK